MSAKKLGDFITLKRGTTYKSQLLVQSGHVQLEDETIVAQPMLANFSYSLFVNFTIFLAPLSPY